MNIIQFVHIEDNSWKGIYLNGYKISDGYYNLDEFNKMEQAFIEWGGGLCWFLY